MKNLLGSIFRFFQRLSVPPRGVSPVSPQQLREALCQMLSDPETRPLLLKSIMGEARPAGANDPPAADVSAGTFGENTGGGNYSFPGALSITANVGIGTPSWGVRLAVLSTVAGDVSYWILSKSGAVGDAQHITFLMPNTAGNLASTAGLRAVIEEVDAENARTGLGFITGQHNYTAERMRITGGGDVGIGTTAPSEKLDVAGNLRVSGASAFGPGTTVYNSQATGYVVVFVDSTYTDTQQEVRGIDGNIYSAFVNTLDYTIVQGKIYGWDRFGIGAAVEVIETNKEYIRGAQKGVAAECRTKTPTAIDAWQANHSYSFQKLVQPTVPNGRYYRVITAGTSGSTEPAWPTTDGQTFFDNTAEWQETPLVELMFGFQSFIGVAVGTSVGEWYGVVVSPPGPNEFNTPPHEADPGTIRTGYGMYIRDLGEDSTILPSGNAAAIKIDGVGNYGRILWTSCSVYCSSSGVLELNATTANFSGVVNSATGFRIGGAAAPSGHYLRGNGSSFVDSAIQAADIPNLDASKITTGQFASSQIPDLDAGKITSGQFVDARMPADVVMMKDGSTKKVACGMQLVSAASGGTPGSVTINTGLSSIAAITIAHIWTTSANAAGTVSSVSGGSFNLNNELSSAEYFYWIAIGT